MSAFELWLERFWVGMAVHLWQSTLFLLVLFGVARLLRRTSARVLAALYWVGVVKLLLPLPLLGPVSDRIVSTVGNAASTGMDAIETGWSTVTVFMVPLVFDQASSRFFPPAVLAIGTAGWLLVVGHVLRREHVRRLTRPSRRRFHVDEQPGKLRCRLVAALSGTGLRAEDVSVSPHGGGPVVEGLARPKIVLPGSVIEELETDELRAVLIHEREHLLRRDPLRYALLGIVRAAFWFYPPIWWLARRIRETTEMACDEAVVRSGLPAATYCRSLARTLRLGLSQRAVVSPVGLFGHRSSFMQRRLERIRCGRRFETMTAHRITLIAVAVAALVVSLLPVTPTVSQARAGTSSSEELARLEDANLPVRLDFDDVTMERLLEALSRTSGVEFRTVGDLGEQRVSITLPKMALAEALLQLGQTAGVKFRVVDPRTVEVLPVALAGKDGVTMPILIPESKVNPAYPEAAREEGLVGRVVLRALIDRTGAVGEVEVLSSDPEDYQPFMDSAVEAIRQWRYEPATRDGAPVDVLFTILVNFRLEEQTKPTL